MLALGICGGDREIVTGRYGWPPLGRDRLVQLKAKSTTAKKATEIVPAASGNRAALQMVTKAGWPAATPGLCEWPLSGSPTRAASAGRLDWRREIVDQHEDERFAWRSVEGSDCAGRTMFHRLSKRLMRLEHDFDVLRTSAAEAVGLNTPLARRRTEIELRRFKARGGSSTRRSTSRATKPGRATHMTKR
jgi:hypothetical protein